MLLWLHGGPGAAQMPLAHATTRALERDFVVVHWDQRGAGKSNPRDFDPATMTLERFLLDAHEITRHLQARLDTDRIIVLGHSWGSMLGARLVARWPRDFAGYIAVGQQVSTTRGIAVTLDRLAPLIRADGRAENLRWLEDATPETLLDHPAYVGMMQMLDAFGGGMTCLCGGWRPCYSVRRNTASATCGAGSTAPTAAAGQCGLTTAPAN